MASFTNGTESALLSLIFTATNWANIADNTATALSINNAGNAVAAGTSMYIGIEWNESPPVQ